MKRSFWAFVQRLISASYLSARDLEAARFFHTNSTGRWLRVYAAPVPSLCFLIRAATSFEMPV